MSYRFGRFPKVAKNGVLWPQLGTKMGTVIALAVSLAACAPFKYSDVPFTDINEFGHSYSVAIKPADSGAFDVIVASMDFRWLPDEMETRQEFLSVGRKRALDYCGDRPAELIDAAKPWASYAGLEMRFRCK